MSVKSTRLYIQAVLLLAMAATSGCSLNRMSLVKSGDVKIKTEYDGKIDITSADVYPEEDKVVIIGKVGRRHSRSYSRFAVTGHVDIGLFDADGNTLKEITAPISPSRIKGKGARSSFQVGLQMDLPKDSLIHLRFHNTVKTIDSSSPHEFN